MRIARFGQPVGKQEQLVTYLDRLAMFRLDAHALLLDADQHVLADQFVHALAVSADQRLRRVTAAAGNTPGR